MNFASVFVLITSILNAGLCELRIDTYFNNKASGESISPSKEVQTLLTDCDQILLDNSVGDQQIVFN